MNDYPFQLENAFFIETSIRRSPKMSSEINLPIAAQVKITDKEKKTQVNILVKSKDDSPLNITIELVGIFSHIDDRAKDLRIKYDFIAERGIFMLWSYVVQMTRAITSQMGMNTLNIATPIEFSLEEMKKAMKIGDD